MQHMGTSPGATFFRGSKPIDGIWVSGDLDICNACVMPFGYRVGDHPAFILDVPLELLIRVDPVKIVKPVGRGLNSRLAGCCKAYIKSLEANITCHCLLERTYDAYTGTYSEEVRAKRVIVINEEGKAYMRRAKKSAGKSSAVGSCSCRRPRSGYGESRFTLQFFVITKGE